MRFIQPVQETQMVAWLKFKRRLPAMPETEEAHCQKKFFDAFERGFGNARVMHGEFVIDGRSDFELTTCVQGTIAGMRSGLAHLRRDPGRKA